MTLDPTGRVDHEERLSAALLDYLDDLHSGRPPDREAFLAANPDPDLRDDLLAFLDGHEEVVRLTAPLRGAASPAAGKGAPSRMTSIGRRGIEDVSSDAPVGARPRSASWAISTCCASWGGAGWAWCTRPSRSPFVDASR